MHANKQTQYVDYVFILAVTSVSNETKHTHVVHKIKQTSHQYRYQTSEFSASISEHWTAKT